MLCTVLWMLAASSTPAIKDQIKETEDQFYSIAFMPESTLEDPETNNKMNLVAAAGSFITDADYEQIKEYYVKELQNEGWVFDEETEVIQGDPSLSFHKDKYSLSLTYYNDYKNRGYTYDITIECRI